MNELNPFWIFGAMCAIVAFFLKNLFSKNETYALRIEVLEKEMELLKLKLSHLDELNNEKVDSLKKSVDKLGSEIGSFKKEIIQILTNKQNEQNNRRT